MKKHEINKKQNSVTLLRHAAVPSHTLLKEAAVSMCFTGLSLPQDIKAKKREKRKVEDGIVIHYEFDRTPFAVNYNLMAKYDPAQKIDVGGTLGARRDDEHKGPSEEEKEMWLDQARRERTHLQEVKNGPDLLDAYTKHQNVYIRAFDTNMFCTTWTSDGVEAMVRDTHEALLQNNAEINTKTYAPEKDGDEFETYNYKAFEVKSEMVYSLLALTGAKSSLNPAGANYLTESSLTEALAAINEFANRVYSTGNDKENTTPMTKESVYEAVSNPPKSRKRKEGKDDPYEEFAYYCARLENEKNGGVNTEKDRYGREAYFRGLMEEMAQRNSEGVLLHEGTFEGVIPDEGFEMDLLLRRENGKTKEIVVLQVKTPAFDIDVDSEKWSQEYKEALETKVQDVSFVGQNVIGIVRDGIGQIVRKEVAKYEAINI